MLEDKDQKHICIYCKKEMVYMKKFYVINMDDVLYQEAIKKLDSIKN